jgi:ribosome-binding ATPase YchF (GTP1/OBG family)
LCLRVFVATLYNRPSRNELKTESEHMQIGIVGLPFCGKSTLFQTITKTHLDPSVLSKSEAHHAIVKVPDVRLDKCSEIFSPKSTVFATIDFVDVVGLKKGESGSTQFTTNFLGNVKTNDALVQVVRLFANDVVPHPDGSIDAMRDIVAFETEFILSDLGLVETRVDRIKKQHRAGRVGRVLSKTVELPLGVLFRNFDARLSTRLAAGFGARARK